MELSVYVNELFRCVRKESIRIIFAQLTWARSRHMVQYRRVAARCIRWPALARCESL